MGSTGGQSSLTEAKKQQQQQQQQQQQKPDAAQRSRRLLRNTADNTIMRVWMVGCDRMVGPKERWGGGVCSAGQRKQQQQQQQTAAETTETSSSKHDNHLNTRFHQTYHRNRVPQPAYISVKSALTSVPSRRLFARRPPVCLIPVGVLLKRLPTMPKLPGSKTSTHPPVSKRRATKLTKVTRQNKTRPSSIVPRVYN
jgi:hypothetical protein